MPPAPRYVPPAPTAPAPAPILAPRAPTRASVRSLAPWAQDARAAQILARIAMAGAAVGRQLEAARAQRDVVRTLCANDKLQQIDVALRAAMERKTALADAAKRDDANASEHEYTILVVLGQRADQLLAEANQCIGEEVAFVGATQVVTQIEPGLPTGDMTDYPPTDPTLVTGPPQCTSCTGGP